MMLPPSMDAGPAEAVAQALEQRLDGAFAVIGNGCQRVGEEGELLVLGADPPLRLGLRALRKLLDKLRLGLDRHARLGAVGSGSAHKLLPVKIVFDDVSGRP